jgi:phospholipid transport system substrate-binding protein
MGDFAENASEEQRQRFADVLKNSLMSTVTTYTQGLAGTGEYKIDVVPPKEGDAEKRSVNVGLEVQTGESVNRLAFTMRLNKEEQWKIANMTLNGINLGITFRAQFAQAVKKANGNLDAAIDSWSA